MKFNRLFLLPLFLLSVYVGGCLNEPPVDTENTGAQNMSRLEKLSLPAGATLVSADFHIFVTNDINTETVEIHRITSLWGENTVTQANFGSAYDPFVYGTFVPDAVGWEITDITTLVQQWLDGTYENYGLLLKFAVSTTRTAYRSSEWATATFRPKLVIVYELGGTNYTVTIQRGFNGTVIDSYIWELNPNTNYGTSTLLYTGITQDYEKFALLQFDLDLSGEGCTLTPGYWKTHSIYGPAPYDNTWANIGENTIFFLSGQSYYTVINTPPGTSAYYQLAFQYIASALNQYAGASIPPAVLTAFNTATGLFNTYTPAQIAALANNDPLRKQFVQLAGVLGDYNSGITGPGHCFD